MYWNSKASKALDSLVGLMKTEVVLKSRTAFINPMQPTFNENRGCIEMRNKTFDLATKSSLMKTEVVLK